MQVTDLSAEQRSELKQSYVLELCESGALDDTTYGGMPSYLLLADADELISDALLNARYEGFSFTNDDFWCTAGEEEQ